MERRRRDRRGAWDDRWLLVEECKWSRRRVGPEVLQQLMERPRRIPGLENHRRLYCLFSRSGFGDIPAREDLLKVGEIAVGIFGDDAGWFALDERQMRAVIAAHAGEALGIPRQRAVQFGRELDTFLFIPRTKPELLSFGQALLGKYGAGLEETVPAPLSSSAPAAQPTSVQQPLDARRLMDDLGQLGAEVPTEEWDKLPADLTDQLDHYLYGTPRR